jgi:hypothetical protein
MGEPKPAPIRPAQWNVECYLSLYFCSRRPLNLSKNSERNDEALESEGAGSLMKPGVSRLEGIRHRVSMAIPRTRQRWPLVPSGDGSPSSNRQSGVGSPSCGKAERSNRQMSHWALWRLRITIQGSDRNARRKPDAGQWHCLI